MFLWFFLFFLFFPCLTLTALSPPLSSVYLITFLIIHFSSCFHEAEMGGGPSQTINSLSSEWQRAASLSCGHHSLCHPSPQQAEHPAAQQGAVSHINLSHFTILTFLMSLPLSSITRARDHPQSPRFPSQGIFAALGRAQERGSTTSRLSWDFPPFSAEPALPDPWLVMLAEMSETVTPPAQLLIPVPDSTQSLQLWQQPQCWVMHAQTTSTFTVSMSAAVECDACKL